MSLQEEKIFRDSCLPLQQKNSCCNFRSAHLIFTPDNILVRPSKLIYIIPAAGCLSTIFPLAAFCIAAGNLLPMLFLPFAVCISGIALFCIHRKRRPEFDLRNHLFYPAGRLPGSKYKEPHSLKDLSELFLLQKTVSAGKNGTFQGYELNLRMKNGKIFNLLNHGHRKGITEDGKKLSEILQIPLELKLNPADAEKQKKKNAEGLLIIGCCFLVIGIIANYFTCIRPMVQYTNAKHWTTAPAVIRVSNVSSHRGSKGTTYGLDIQYHYSWNGKHYTSRKYDFFTYNSANSSFYRKIVKKYPVGKTTTCYVNPANPGEAVLNREFPLPALYPMLFTALFAVIGTGLTAFSIVSIRKSKF